MLSAAAGSEAGNRYRASSDASSLSSDPPLAVVADGAGPGGVRDNPAASVVRSA